MEKECDCCGGQGWRTVDGNYEPICPKCGKRDVTIDWDKNEETVSLVFWQKCVIAVLILILILIAIMIAYGFYYLAVEFKQPPQPVLGPFNR